ncbi:uncharacterized protein LOC108679584, partial [Hyalella azteca]|uniref:Uncharacterized protein LOC108679584 n=1 Tax=Hyalella azteca TaxID=294128 RepID=A0A8B7PC33_HYAAZ
MALALCQLWLSVSSGALSALAFCQLWRSVSSGALSALAFCQLWRSDLLADLFDASLVSADDDLLRAGGVGDVAGPPPPGMGSCVTGSGPDGRYQGFGTGVPSAPSLVNKVRGLVDRMLWPEVQPLSPAARSILSPDPGRYAPYEIPCTYLAELAPCLGTTMP